LRIDTVAEVPKDFWREFSDAAGVYAVGEVFDGRHDYVADYQNYLPALLNYPVYFTALSVFAYGNSCM
jgi:alpha-amylase